MGYTNEDEGPNEVVWPAEKVGHTPLPWAICASAPNPLWVEGSTIFCPAEGRRVADPCLLDERAKANAALIVRSVNAVPDLVAALEKARAAIYTDCNYINAIAAIDAALAKVKP